MLVSSAIVLSMVGVAVASAQTTPAAVMVILAKEEAGTIDPQVRKIGALRRPPFNAFRSMKLLAKPSATLTVGHPHELSLPNGRKLRLVVEQVLPDGRYRVRVSINRPERKDYLPLLQVVASPGDPFFVAGQKHEGGTLIVGISVGEAPATTH